MANKYLCPIFKMIYGCNFDYSNFDQRMEMQKAIYLLQDMGVPVGNYGFRWYLHGPYSQSLQDDMYYENKKDYGDIILSKEYVKKIKKLGSLIKSDKKGNYSASQWAECLASLHYLRENVMSFSVSDKNLIDELQERKPHLNNREVNKEACGLLKELFDIHGKRRT